MNQTHGVIMNPVSDTELENHQQRVKDCQAFFKECLRRYKEQREHVIPPRTDAEIIEMSLRTLVKNGYSRLEILDAMGERRVPA